MSQILVDYRAGGVKVGGPNAPQLIVEHLNRLGIKAEKTDLQYGDFAFEGNGPDGTISIGVERKTLHDILNCIDDARYAGHQRIGMKQMYTLSYLMMEGHWKPHDPTGIMMEGFSGGSAWGYCKYRSQRTPYSKLYRYLLSVGLAGVIITYSRDIFHTAYNLHEMYHYFQKKWDAHTSMKEIHQLNIPTMNRKPNLVRKWAASLDDIGVKLSEQADRVFRSPLELANADESEWLRVPGVGVKTAQDIVREIWRKR